MRLFYATAAAADFIRSYELADGRVATLGFADQIIDFARIYRCETLLVSGHADGRRLRDGNIQFRHFQPKIPPSGIRWKIGFIRHGLKLLKMAEEFRADAAVIDSGTMPHFCLELFRRKGIRSIPVLHNPLHKLTGPTRAERVMEPLSRAAFARTTPISVSPAVHRQVGCGIEIRAQFFREYFEQIPRPQFTQPFRVLFAGRVEENKGVFDIVEAARICGNRVVWVICGGGSELERLREASKGLPIEVMGHISNDGLLGLRASTHAVVVPTRTSFGEGLAMSAVEAILSGRPLITNRNVPALELVRAASVEHEPDDPASIAAAALSLADDMERWKRLVGECPHLVAQFYDRRHGLTSALAHIFFPERSNYISPTVAVGQ